MKFSVLSSGSSGNSTYIESGGGEFGGLLVDDGISCRRLKPLLGSIGRSIADVGAVLLTHGHSDHTSGLRTLLKERRVSVLCAPGVGKKLGARVIDAAEDFEVCGIEARFFDVPHDAPTYGVRLSNEDVGMGVITDFGEVSQGMIAALGGVDALVVEANHDLEWLRHGPYPYHLKQRIISSNGHLSNEQAADLALSLVPHGLTEVVLAHLSEKNNSPARATGTVARVLREAGFPGVRVRASVAKRPTPWIEVGAPPVPEEQVRFVYGGEAGHPDSGGLFGISGG